MCTQRLNNGPLVCTRTDPHGAGHVYVSATGSDVDDRHTGGGHG